MTYSLISLYLNISVFIIGNNAWLDKTFLQEHNLVTQRIFNISSFSWILCLKYSFMLPGIYIKKKNPK